MDKQNQEIIQLQLAYDKLSKDYKKQTRELNLLKRQMERTKRAAEAKENMNKVITARRLELEKYLKLLMENFPDIVLLFDSENSIVYGTDSFLYQCEIPSFSTIKGMHYKELLSPFAGDDFMERIENGFLKAWKKKQVVELVEDIDFSKSGKLRNYSINIAPMIGIEGMVEGAMLLFYDFTELLASQKEAERANAAKSDFLAMISHEIRTPINVIMGFADMLKHTMLSDIQERYLSNIDDASKMLLNLINDILDFSKIEAEKLVLIKEYFDVSNMLEHIKVMFDVTAEEKQISLVCDFDSELPKAVYGDEGRIRQILVNLISNALKYTDAGTVLFQVGMVNEDTISFVVHDTGVGIKEEEFPRLFGAFEQLDIVNNKKRKGTGLGLAITKRLCDLMDGSITVTSEYKKGSAFTVHLPVTVGKETDLASSGKEEGIQFLAPDARILVVDDMELNLEIVEYMLSLYEISSEKAYNGEEAIQKVKENKYDMILMDYRMPIMDGAEAAKTIRSWGDTIPIIFLTADLTNGTEDVYKESGLNGFLSKPIHVKDLEDVLLEWLPKGKLICKDSV